MTDRDLVRLFWEDLARQGYRLSSICEPQEDGGIAILYAAPGFLEECFSDQGLPVPDDIPAGAGRAWLLYGGRVLREGRPQVVPVRPFFGRATSATVTNKSVRNRPVSGRLASGPKGEPISFPYRWGANLSPHPPLSFYGRTRKTDWRPLSTKKFRNGCLPPFQIPKRL